MAGRVEMGDIAESLWQMPQYGCGQRSRFKAVRKYGGELIHADRDTIGLVEVVEAHGVRALHFGSSARQSALSLADPEHLELPYLRAMLAALLLLDRFPQRILMLGLGGGSLCRFILGHNPDCRIDAVEARELVAITARQYFGLPKDPRLNVHIADGLAFLRDAAASGQHRYGLIFVDLFDGEGPAAILEDPAFFAAVRAVLEDEGVVAVNLWSGRPGPLREILERIARQFEGGVKRLNVIGRGNVIAFGLGPAVLPWPRKVTQRRAEYLEQRLGVELTRLWPQLSETVRTAPSSE
jgi:spermidine synthase